RTLSSPPPLSLFILLSLSLSLCQGDKSVRVMRSLLAAQQTFVDRLVQLMKAVQRESGNRKKKVTRTHTHTHTHTPTHIERNTYTHTHTHTHTHIERNTYTHSHTHTHTHTHTHIERN